VKEIRMTFGQFNCYFVFKRDSFKVGMMAHLRAEMAFRIMHIKPLLCREALPWKNAGLLVATRFGPEYERSYNQVNTYTYSFNPM